VGEEYRSLRSSLWSFANGVIYVRKAGVLMKFVLDPIANYPWTQQVSLRVMKYDRTRIGIAGC
jgi:hypothetical protein